MSPWLDNFWALMQRGGPVMWPLLATSLVGLTLVIERGWFWLRLHRAARLATASRLARALRDGDREQAQALARDAGAVYGRFALDLLDEPVTDAAIADAIERCRRPLERYMAVLSTIITAAPMLGILGTVLGIITSFELMGDASATDPRQIGPGIAQALLTTAVGLAIAIVVLLAYNVFRTQLDHALGRLEVLGAAAMQAGPAGNRASLPHAGEATIRPVARDSRVHRASPADQADAASH